jgi:wyosine [tRNA(Phe)-imidazoG37] synthetase (radical SAM superfamily)
MKYTFGPVPSRRLGQSLGIDTIPLKTCNWNCVYCQLGRSIPVTNERKEYYPRQEIVDEVRQVVAAHGPRQIDWLTFVGSGEPTLHIGIGWLIREVKALSNLPVAVITNGSLLYRPDVRQELMAADAVMPTFDCGSPDLYRRIIRPHPEITFERHVQGLVEFSREYEGKLWVELMLMRGLNDSEEALRDIAAILRQVQPDAVNINLPTRPPAETWVHVPDKAAQMRACAILGTVARVVPPTEGIFDLDSCGDDSQALVDAIVNVITRHPMSDTDIWQTVQRIAPGKGSEVLSLLEASGRAQSVRRNGSRFWSAAPSHYPEEARSIVADPRRHPRRTKEPTP